MTGPVRISPARPHGLGASIAVGIVRRLLAMLDAGCLTVVLPSGAIIEHRGSRPGPTAQLNMKRWRAVRRLVLEGDVGFAGAYVEGDWSSPDLTALIELGALNGQKFMDAVAGSTPFRIANWIGHRFRANTKTGSRRNIEFHYDLGNQFYRFWLDSSMNYSSAIFGRAEATLEEAQETKLRRIVETLRVPQGGNVLEIGCGWGALASTMAQDAGANVTGLTISPAQLQSATELVRARSLEKQVDLRLQDYRDVEGTFDRIVSIEMIEAVGREFLPGYFDTIRSRLKPGGLCVLQAITIAEDRFADYCRRPDFIQRYIFPGGFLPTKTLLRETMESAGLRLTAIETFGDSYALTLREWRRRFLIAWPDIQKLGFTPSFRRLWEYYLCYCEAGFRAGAIDVGLYSVEHAEAAPA
jgi:cyclopropane-fatty-acyl-phospholipid synthase